jgi:hypothetical protein
MNKTQTKPAVDREAVRVLAIELGAREAARRLGIKESTVLSWARRYNWKLPKRKGGAISAITLHSKPEDALIAKHKELEDVTKTALMQTVAKAAKLAAQKPAMDVTTTAQLRDLALTMARLYGWDGKPQAEVNITNQVGVGVVITEEERARLSTPAPFPRARACAEWDVRVLEARLPLCFLDN